MFNRRSIYQGLKKIASGYIVCRVFAITKYVDDNSYHVTYYDLLYIKKFNKFVLYDSTLNNDIESLLWGYRWSRNDEELYKSIKEHASFGILNYKNIERVFNIHIYNVEELLGVLYKEKKIGKKLSRKEKKELDKRCDAIVKAIQEMSKKIIEKNMK